MTGVSLIMVNSEVSVITEIIDLTGKDARAAAGWRAEAGRQEGRQEAGRRAAGEESDRETGAGETGVGVP